MKKFIVLCIFIASLLEAAGWNYTKEVRLSKDQIQTVFVREGSVLKVLKFRWTLYAGDGLVMHLNYNDKASQFILYKHHKKDAYRVRLLAKKSVQKRVEYLYLVFKKFDYKTKQAHFDILVDDPEKRALIEVKPLREKN